MSFGNLVVSLICLYYRDKIGFIVGMNFTILAYVQSMSNGIEADLMKVQHLLERKGFLGSITDDREDS